MSKRKTNAAKYLRRPRSELDRDLNRLIARTELAKMVTETREVTPQEWARILEWRKHPPAKESP